MCPNCHENVMTFVPFFWHILSKHNDHLEWWSRMTVCSKLFSRMFELNVKAKQHYKFETYAVSLQWFHLFTISTAGGTGWAPLLPVRSCCPSASGTGRACTRCRGGRRRCPRRWTRPPWTWSSGRRSWPSPSAESWVAEAEEAIQGTFLTRQFFCEASVKANFVSDTTDASI